MLLFYQPHPYQPPKSFYDIEQIAQLLTAQDVALLEQTSILLDLLRNITQPLPDLQNQSHSAP